MVYENVVVGSGISALGCIVGLLKSKKKVLCIDGSENNLELLNKSENKEIEFSEQNIPLKKFSFEKKSKKFFKPIEVLESYSFGGLSNVWGASALRYLENDLDESEMQMNWLGSLKYDHDQILKLVDSAWNSYKKLHLLKDNLVPKHPDDLIPKNFDGLNNVTKSTY